MERVLSSINLLNLEGPRRQLRISIACTEYEFPEGMIKTPTFPTQTGKEMEPKVKMKMIQIRICKKDTSEPARKWQ